MFYQVNKAQDGPDMETGDFLFFGPTEPVKQSLRQQVAMVKYIASSMGTKDNA